VFFNCKVELEVYSFTLKVEDSKRKINGSGMKIVYLLWLIGFLVLPIVSVGQEVNREGWPVPDLRGLIPYSIQVRKVDGVEKIIEKYYTPEGGHIARISGNGKIFAYVVDSDRDPPIDYLLLDPDGSGKFTEKYRSEDSYMIPEWVSH
jgi:hypothetical protein